MIKQRVQNILGDLERVRENLLALSDDIWLNIDHNDTDALQEGVRFKKEYNEKLAAFDQLATELSILVQQFTNVGIDFPEPETGKQGYHVEERVVKELNKQKGHTLDEDFSYKRPIAFILKGMVVKPVTTWKRLYEQFLLLLADMDRTRFDALPVNPDYESTHGNKAFSRNLEEFRAALVLQGGVYAESNLSANHICNRMKQLLKTFGIQDSEMVIYLRQDRDA